MKKRTVMICVALAAIMFASFIQSAGKVIGNGISDVKDKIADTTDQKADIKNQLKDVQNEIESRQSELEKKSLEFANLIREQNTEKTELENALEELDELYAQIEDLQNTIDEEEAEYNAALQLFFKRTAIISKYTDTSFLSLFTQSKNIFSYSDLSRMMTDMLSSDRLDMNELEIMKKDLEEKKKMAEGNRDMMEAIKAEKEVIIEKLQNSQDILAADIDASRALIDELEAQEDDLEVEAKKLTDEIKSLQKYYDQLIAEEKARKEAEEKARKEAEAKAKKEAEAKAKKEAEEKAKKEAEKAYKASKLLWPAEEGTRISSSYGYRIHPILKVRKFHSGIDIPAPGGSNILAANDGTVITAKWNDSYGYYVIIYHGDGMSTLYAHSKKLLVKVGDKVKRGQTIAYVGTTGSSTGNHLHFEVRIDGNTVNPLDYLP